MIGVAEIGWLELGWSEGGFLITDSIVEDEAWMLGWIPMLCV
jgi:hypothetical protein